VGVLDAHGLVHAAGGHEVGVVGEHAVYAAEVRAVFEELLYLLCALVELLQSQYTRIRA